MPYFLKQLHIAMPALDPASSHLSTLTMPPTKQHCKFLTPDRKNIINWCLDIRCKNVVCLYDKDQRLQCKITENSVNFLHY